MIDLSVKEYMARTSKNTMSLAGMLDRMKGLYKSIAFECRVMHGEYDDLFDDHMKELCNESIQYMFGELYYLQSCIDYGNYKEVNNYAG